MPEAFFQLSITLGIALVLSLVMKLMRQPLIIGYIITGIIVGPVVTGIISEKETLEAFSHIGVALLLFIVGLGLKPKLIREVGKIAVLTGLGQIIFTTIGGFVIGKLLGFSNLASGYLSLAFTLSSTIIILRLLYSKDEQDSLYGRISIGFMLVQDIFAMLMFLVISSTTAIGSGSFLTTIFYLMGKLGLIVIGLYVLMNYITPRVDKIFAKNKEMLFVFSLGMCFIIATIFNKLGFSLELGALAAGVVLSVSPFQREIATRIHPLRDFFLIIFFIVMGANINFLGIAEYIPMIIIFSLFILIGNTFIMTLIMRLMKYTTRTSFFAGLTVSQISEFSLILVGMGVSLGHLEHGLLGPVTLIGLITIAISSYFITYNHQIYKFIKPFLHKIFGESKNKIEEPEIEENVDVLLFGCHVTGGGLVRQFKKQRVNYLAIDHDPKVVSELSERGVSIIFGSADDSELLDTIPHKNLKMVISTVPDYDVNSFMISYFKKRKKGVNIICVTNHYKDAKRLYSQGATYVLMPPYLGRRFITDLFKINKMDRKKYTLEKKRHLADYKYIEDKLI